MKLLMLLITMRRTRTARKIPRLWRPRPCWVPWLLPLVVTRLLLAIEKKLALLGSGTNLLDPFSGLRGLQEVAAGLKLLPVVRLVVLQLAFVSTRLALEGAAFRPVVRVSRVVANEIRRLLASRQAGLDVVPAKVLVVLVTWPEVTQVRLSLVQTPVRSPLLEKLRVAWHVLMVLLG